MLRKRAQRSFRNIGIFQFLCSVYTEHFSRSEIFVGEIFVWDFFSCNTSGPVGCAHSSQVYNFLAERAVRLIRHAHTRHNATPASVVHLHERKLFNTPLSRLAHTQGSHISATHSAFPKTLPNCLSSLQQRFLVQVQSHVLIHGKLLSVHLFRLP